MKIGFQDESFAFELVRNLGFIYYGGCDLGEMMATVPRIREGDIESWYAAWEELGRKLLGRAEASRRAGHLVSARAAYLHASTYLRMSEFYLHGNPQDPRILDTARASQTAYAEGAKLSGPTWEAVEISYDGTTLPGYFYKVDDSGTPRPTVIFHGGYDSSVEELYYYGGAPAVRRGYNCLTFDGPGQGLPLREGGLVFRHDWEKVVSPAVDYALGRSDVDGDKLALIGMSLGGYLAARAAAFEHRFKATVLFDGVYSFYDSLPNLLPPEAMAAYETGDVAACEAVTRERMAHNTGLRWAVEQGLYSFGVEGVAGLIEATKKMTMDGIAGQITSPCLVMEADGDVFFRGQPQRIFDAITAPKTFARFTDEYGAENHCQSGALAYKDEVVFNWLDETLGLRQGRPA